ncbi:MAG: hypothetical protein QOI83_1331, partial [Streptomycetaceae bacterium]|nr:hypothetical protein [Streptomycetaceae bacterium]
MISECESKFTVATMPAGFSSSMEEGDQEQDDRLVEADQVAQGGVVEDRPGLADIGQQERGVAGAGQLGARVGGHNGVVVYIGRADAGGDLPGDLMGLGRGGNSGADVDDLPD